MLMVAGIPVAEPLAHEIASRLRGFGDLGDLDAAEKLEMAMSHDRCMVALTVPDRDAILSVLEDPPAGLEELRGVLLREHEWRQREGL